MSNLPVLTDDDGFNSIAPTDDQIIVGTLLKCIEGKWSADGVEVPPSTRLLAFGTDKFLQRWHDQQAETIREKPLPDPDELNAKIPKSEWEIGLDGNPRPPWQKIYAVYLLDERTAEKFTFVNGTVGAKRAVHDLQDRVASKRMLCHAPLIAEVELRNKPMKTRFGVKRRPHFEIVGWRQIGEAGTPRITQASEPTTAEELNDEIPF
jgi:hypothetical protein